MIWWQPDAAGVSTRPGTAMHSRPCSSTHSRAVINAPERFAASTTNTPSDMPEMIRFRRGKFSGFGPVAIGSSLTTAPRPSATICSNTGTWSFGYGTPSPEPITAEVRPPTRSTARWAAISTP